MSNQNLTPEFQTLLGYLKNSRGFDFSGYKTSTLIRRINKRMESIAIARYSDYIDYLEVHPDEFSYLFNTILINVTGFFRDRPAWDYIIKEIVPQIVANKQPGEPIRLWSAGCASGEETFTLAMVLAEYIGIEASQERVKIFATDVDEEALNQARQASYIQKDIAEIPPDLQEKYFERQGTRYLFNKDLRRSIVFGRHNLIKDAPIAKIDLLLCRNTLMYFNSEGQQKIIDRFHFAINDTGFLFLGKAEMLFSRSNQFIPVDLKRRVFTKVPNHSNRRSNQSVMPQPETEEIEAIDPGNKMQLYEFGFNIDPVAQVVVDINGSLALANDSACTMFNLKPSDVGRPLQDLEISYRPVELRSPIQQVYESRRSITLNDVEGPPISGEARYLAVNMIPLQNSNSNLIGVKIIFTDVTRYKKLQEELQQTNQELEAAYEELQSSNEELETTNEELQSTNEELQSLNEELHQRTTQLNQLNVFLESILTSVHLGVVVVDEELQIQIWNHKASDMWGLRFDEVQRMYFLDQDIGLPVEQLRQPLQACLKKDASHQELTLEAINRRGRSIQCKVTCTPLRDTGTAIEGVVVLMEELST